MNSNHSFAASIAASVLVLLGSSCSTSKESASTDSAKGEWQSEFHVAANDWSSHGSNPYFVLEPGYVLEFADKSGKEHLTITVLAETEVVDGVETRVVEERETVDGKPKEVSRNFFAMSKSTNDVYYFGEQVDIYKKGAVTSHEGGWRSGVKGARFGLVMPGEVRVGARFYQENAPGEAMDRFEITSLDKTLDTPAGHFDHCLQVEETTPLEAGEKEYKLYARGIGLIQDEDLLLVSHGKR
jgi:hypothetical protein